MWDIIHTIIVSFGEYIHLVFKRQLHLSRQHLDQAQAIADHGTYTVFRETVSNQPAQGDEEVLVVGFRLKVLRSSRALHWLFQRLCILSTPFWSGLVGFQAKLWMVDPVTHNYLGIYRWRGRANAQHYVDTLRRVLVPLSTPNSVWYQLKATGFDTFLRQTRVAI